jgi:hypothetical protein
MSQTIPGQGEGYDGRLPGGSPESGKALPVSRCFERAPVFKLFKLTVPAFSDFNEDT